MKPRRLRAAIVGAALVARASTAAASESAVVSAVIEVDGAHCLSQGSLARDVAHLLDRDVLDPRLHVHVTEHPEDVEFSVEWDGVSQGKRSFRRSSCPEMRAVVGASIAAAVEAALERAEPIRVRDSAPRLAVPSPRPQAASDAPVEPLAPSPEHATDKVHSTRVLVLHTGARWGVGGVSSTSLGAVLGAAYGFRSVSLESVLGVTAPAYVALGAGRVRVTEAKFSLGPCVSSSSALRSSVIFRGCVDVRAGVYFVAGDGFATNYASTILGAGITSHVDALIPFSRSSSFGVIVSIEGDVALTKTELQSVDMPGNVRARVAAPALGAAGTLGLFFRSR